MSAGRFPQREGPQAEFRAGGLPSGKVPLFATGWPLATPMIKLARWHSYRTGSGFFGGFLAKLRCPPRRPWHGAQSSECEHPLVDGVSVGGIAFFFVLSLQGQILRVAKNVRDEQDAEEFRASFASIQQGLEELRKQQPSATAKRRKQRRQQRREETVDRLMADAKRALASESYYAAATLAAVAFERAIRDTVPDARAQRLSIRAILNLLTLGGHEGQLEEFTTLLKLRNNLVHAEATRLERQT